MSHSPRITGSEARRHPVESGDHEAELVAAADGEAPVELAASDGARGGADLGETCEERAGDGPVQPGGGGERPERREDRPEPEPLREASRLRSRRLDAP